MSVMAITMLTANKGKRPVDETYSYIDVQPDSIDHFHELLERKIIDPNILVAKGLYLSTMRGEESV
jgi:hypothetical protein